MKRTPNCMQSLIKLRVRNLPNLPQITIQTQHQIAAEATIDRVNDSPRKPQEEEQVVEIYVSFGFYSTDSPGRLVHRASTTTAAAAAAAAVLK